MKQESDLKNWIFYSCIALIVGGSICWVNSQQHKREVEEKQEQKIAATQKSQLDKQRIEAEAALIQKWHINVNEQSDLLSNIQREHFLSEEVQNRLGDQSILWSSGCLEDVVSPAKQGGLYTFKISACHALWGNNFQFNLLGREELAIEAEKGNPRMTFKKPCIAIFTVEHIKGASKIPDRIGKIYEGEGKLLDLKMIP
jgi:hypothetical protein